MAATAARQKAPQALAGLYSAPANQNTVKALTGTKGKAPREQQVYTPPELAEIARRLWGEIALDPCWGPGSCLEARTHYYVPPTLTMTSDGGARLVFSPTVHDQDGLSLPWQDHTFVNPPYDHPYLSQWLAKACAEAALGYEIMLLTPVRPHRTWFRTALREADSVGYLDPVKFLGFESAHPQPLCLLYFGTQTALFAFWLKELELGEAF